MGSAGSRSLIVKENQVAAGMYPKHKPWYKSKWGILPALIISPFWIVWKKSRRNRLLRVIVGGTYALAAFILIILCIAHIFSAKAVKNNGPAANSNAVSGNTSISLTGYGATQSEWNASHTADTNFATNSAYNPTSGLGNGYSDKYTSVLWTNGRALSYQIGFPSGTSMSTAITTVMQEFPSDVSILWQQENSSDSENVCYQMELHSATLGQALENDGDAFVEYQTIETSDTSTGIGYYANNINNVSLRNADYKKPSQASGC